MMLTSLTLSVLVFMGSHLPTKQSTSDEDQRGTVVAGVGCSSFSTLTLLLRLVRLSGAS